MNDTSDKIKVTAKTLEEAVSSAAKELGVSKDQVNYSVLLEGNKGLFGLGAKDIVIEANIATAPATLSDFLPTLLDKMRMPCVVESETTDTGVMATLTSSYAPSIIGKKGETLLALQYLTNIVENKTSPEGSFVRYTLDIENYRQKRVQALEYQAKTAANKVIKTGRSFILNPLNPYERRIVHSYLQSFEGVASHSVGEEPNRKIVITLEHK